MWQGTWRHECTDGTAVDQQSETSYHPLHGDGLPSPCAKCGKSWRLVSHAGPERKHLVQKRKAKGRPAFRSQQSPLF